MPSITVFKRFLTNNNKTETNLILFNQKWLTSWSNVQLREHKAKIGMYSTQCCFTFKFSMLYKFAHGHID
jgi:hypothetical protein